MSLSLNTLLSVAMTGLLGLVTASCAIDQPASRGYDPYKEVSVNHRSSLRAAWSLLHNKQYQQAESACRQLIAQAPELSMAYVLLAGALAAQDKLKEAEQSLGDAIRAEPGNPLARFNLGNLYARQKRPRDAAMQFREAVRLDPQYRKAWLNLAVAEADARRFAQAEEALSKARALGLEGAEVLNLKGTILLDQGLSRDALVEFKAAVELAPGNPTYHMNLGRAYELSERDADARAEYERFLELAPRENPAREAVRKTLKRLRP